MKHPSTESQPIKAPSRATLRAMKILAMLLPVFLLVLLEAGLRVAGVGKSLSLFIPAENQPGFLVMNPDVSQKYFTTQANATIGNREIFPEKKAKGTFRIFVLGESTTIGYPYLHNGAFHRWLKYRLMHNFPDHEVEIINLSLTAVNSYTVHGFAKEVVDQQPDAVLIYVGHNEYYGALGVGSTNFIAKSPALVRFTLWFRELRLVQLAGRAASLFQKSNAPNEDSRETLMKRMAAKQEIPFDSDRFHDGVRQFESNMEKVCSLFQQKGIPVYLSNLVSNERDLPPFISKPGADDVSAAEAYESGQKALLQGDSLGARRLFIQAKELDLLRFRAPEAMNTAILQLSKKYPVVHFVDTRALFEAHSPAGILGHETLLEHVHPNLLGYGLLSEAFYRELRKEQLSGWKARREWTFDELLSNMPITQVDSLKGAYEIMLLKEGWPFLQPLPPIDTSHKKTIEEQLAGALVVRQIAWGPAMNQLLNHYLQQNQAAAALQVTEALILEEPYQPVFYQQAGKLAMNLEQNPLAVLYLNKAFGLHPDPESARNLMITLLKMDQPAAALPYLNYLLSKDPGNQAQIGLLTMVNELIELKQRLESDPDNLALLQAIAAQYLKFANTQAAWIYLNKAESLSPKDNGTLSLRVVLEQISDTKTP